MAMVKLIPPGSYDDRLYMGEPAVKIVKVASSGLRGNDLKAFIKRAGHRFAHFVKEADLKPGDIPVHVIALGATEFYGNNRNGDGFKEATCRDYHDTFVKLARWYRNHDNKEPARSYGHIKHSEFNEDMKRIELLAILNGTKEAADRNGGLVADEELKKLNSEQDIPTSMACALAGTLVKVRNGFKPVELIKIGDEVLTKYGRYRRVNATMRRVKQHVARVYTRFYGRQVLEFTPDHKFWVARWEDIPRHKRSNGIRSKHVTGFSGPTRRKYRDSLHKYARYVPCGELKPGDFLLMPIEHGDLSSSVSVEEARLLGYYISEGSITSDDYACFTCNKADILPKELDQLTDANYGMYDHSASCEAVNIVVYDKPLVKDLLLSAGRGVRSKVIPQSIINATSRIKLEFISAWLNGDGWQDDKGIHWSTCSRTLSIELQNLLASVGIPSSVHRIDHTSDLPGGKKRTGDGVEYTVNISNRFSSRFGSNCKAKTIAKEEHTTAFITGNYLAIPVKKVIVSEQQAEVYDISVEEDESFTAFGLAVSNCKVAYDVCAGCGNKAKNRGEYCTGLDEGGMCKRGGVKNRMCLVHDDGFINHVDNPRPAFFDNSTVFRGADRIAWANGIVKAASGIIIGGAELAEKLGVEMPIAVAEHGLTWTTKLEKLLIKLAKIEQSPVYLDNRYGSVNIFGDDANWTVADGLKKQAYAALLLFKIIPPIEGWVKLAGLNVTDDLIKTAKYYLPGIYTRILTDGKITDNDLRNHIGCGTVTGSLMKWASDLSEMYSLDRDAIEKRAKLASLYGIPQPEVRNSPKIEIAGSAKTLARDYALYKLACLQALEDRDDDFDLTCMIAIMHNYLGE